MKKSVLSFVLSMLLIGSLVACAGDPPPETDTTDNETVVEEKGEDKVENQNEAAGDLTAQGFEKKIFWFNAFAHPFFDVMWEGIEDWLAENPDWHVERVIGTDASGGQPLANDRALAYAAQDYRYFLVTVSDEASAEGCYEELAELGATIINYNSTTSQPTLASFYVGLDNKARIADMTERCLENMGHKGYIALAMESLMDPNMKLAKEAFDETVAKYPEVEVIFSINDMTTQSAAASKLDDAISSTGGKLDGMLCVGTSPSQAITGIMENYYDKGGETVYVYTVDDDPLTLEGIEKGYITGSYTTNQYAQGFLACSLMKYLAEGWRPNPDAFFVNTSQALITKDNINSYRDDEREIVNGILAKFETEYLLPPE